MSPPMVEEEEEDVEIVFKAKVPDLNSGDDPVIALESLFDSVATANQALP
jgi:hypothetical protein